MRKFDISLCEATHRDCSTEPTAFDSDDESYAVMQLHAAHGPDCRRFLAAQAHFSAAIDD